MSSAPSQAPATTSESTPTSSPAPSSGAPRGSVMRKSLAGRDLDVQLALLEPVQRKGGEDTNAVHEAAAQGIASGGGAMPHAVSAPVAFAPTRTSPPVHPYTASCPSRSAPGSCHATIGV